MACDKKFHIVSFYSDALKEKMVVPSIWLSRNDDLCLLPPAITVATMKEIETLARLRIQPQVGWRMYDVTSLQTFDTFAEAKEGLQRIKRASDRESGNSTPKRKKRRPAHLNEYSTSDDDESAKSAEVSRPMTSALPIVVQDIPLSISEPLIVKVEPSSNSRDFCMSLSDFVPFLTSNNERLMSGCSEDNHNEEPNSKHIDNHKQTRKKCSQGEGLLSRGCKDNEQSTTTSRSSKDSPLEIGYTTSASDPSTCPCKSSCHFLILQSLRNIQKQVQRNTYLLQQLLVQQDKPVLDVRSHSLPEALPVTLPVASLTDIEALDIYLKNEFNFAQILPYFTEVGGNDVRQTLKRVMEKIVSTDFAPSLNWKGRGTKKPFSDYTSIHNLVFKAVKHNPKAGSPTLSETEKYIKDWLRFAPERYGRAKEKAGTAGKAT